MVKRIRTIGLSAVLLLLVGCTLLPGVSAPTPFTFPTPNLTHTSIFAEIPTSTNTPSIIRSGGDEYPQPHPNRNGCSPEWISRNSGLPERSSGDRRSAQRVVIDYLSR